MYLVTLISLINVEVGINVEGVQICQITKCGGWNKRGGWDFVEKTNASRSGGWKTSKESINVEGGIFQNQLAWAPRLF
jgi:hypothetical protein